jgi:hypothetical protein
LTRRRRQIFAGAIVLAACAITTAVLATRSSDGASTFRAASPRSVRAALITRLERSHLSYRWVVCIRTGRVFRSHGVIRCNVNFGDPHIEAYCSIFDRGSLVTDHETPSFTCPPDLRGWTAKIVTSP